MGPLIGSHVDPAGGLATRGLAHAAAIGTGLIGLGPFGELVRHPLLADVPFVAETPKASQEGDVAALRQLRDCRLPA